MSAPDLTRLANAIRDHIAICPRNHRGFHHQVSLVVFEPVNAQLICKVCDVVEPLHKQPTAEGDLDVYLCHLLRQQVAFYETHFATCAATEGGVA